MNCKRLVAMLMALVAAIVMCMSFAFAEDDESLPIPYATESEATVSEEVDTATSQDPTMSTKFYIYIPPDPTFTPDVPQMGDAGLDPNILLILAMGFGMVYLGCSRYAYRRT